MEQIALGLLAKFSATGEGVFDQWFFDKGVDIYAPYDEHWS